MRGKQKIWDVIGGNGCMCIKDWFKPICKLSLDKFLLRIVVIYSPKTWHPIPPDLNYITIGVTDSNAICDVSIYLHHALKMYGKWRLSSVILNKNCVTYTSL